MENTLAKLLRKQAQDLRDYADKKEREEYIKTAQFVTAVKGLGILSQKIKQG